MKIKLLNTYSKILSFFLVLLGFPACDSSSDPELGPIAEYGTPSAKFKIKGTVVDKETENAVKNIQVVIGKAYKYEGKTVLHRYDSVKTENSGKFNIDIPDFPQSQKYVIVLEDVDGEENGLYDTKTDTVRFENPQFKNGNGNWNKGETEQDLGKIELTSSKTQE